ncbi:M4 family metallopeptidase [Aureivirga sp. CE67]|uniref:M4 family metallopeptidase n=1 Tax=Aureivirga sp. CE67 TaxID=1788983 RepID=UPI0018CBE2B0|nr:M4 family metallopeptidase [Aureivirga sp. CE67]
MKKNYVNPLVFSLFCAFSLSMSAQQGNGVKNQHTDAFGTPKFINFTEKTTFSQKNIQSTFTQYLNLKQEDSFVKIKNFSDNAGFIHEKYQQYYKGIKVEFATYLAHYKNGKLNSINGEIYRIQNLNTTPSLSPEQAFNQALNHIGADKYLWDYPESAKEMDNYTKPEGELVIIPNYDSIDRGKNVESNVKLAYKFDIYATSPLSRGDVYVDAQTGKILFYNAIIKHAAGFGHTGEDHDHEVSMTPNYGPIAKPHAAPMAVASGTAQTRYSGTQTIETASSGGSYTLNDYGRKIYTRDAKNIAPVGNSYPYVNDYNQFTDNNNNWTTSEHASGKDDGALDAHWGTMKTYDYFNDIHNRDSFDGNGAQIRNYVHVSTNYDNAFWNGSVMSYGDGSSNGNEGNGYFDILTSVDIAAHEIGHAVCDYTAQLVYQRESGAMNEGFSDIWGAAVEAYSGATDSDKDKWLLGEEIDRRSGSIALRSMSNPKAKGQPDTYGGTYWKNVNCGTPTLNNDYCGVHTNSGVLNHWFYILTEGKSGTNDIGNSYNVTGISIEKAAKIAYRLESVYLTSNADYADARTYGIKSAEDLYGANSIEVIATTNAFYAVGIGDTYDDGTPSYCDSKGTNVSDEYINKVQLGSINNTSGSNGGYGNFTSMSTNVSKGQSYTITVTPGWTGTPYDEGYAVWIDFNQDLDFEDAGELVWSKDPSKDTSVSGTFSIPASATSGQTRMRVSMQYNKVSSACETFTYGEVEDYTINIGGSVDNQAPTAPTNLAASNTTKTTTQLSWNSATDNVEVTGYDIYIGTNKIGSTTGTSANITDLTPSTTYTFRVKAKDAANNISGYSNSVSVTTLSNQVTYCDASGNNSSYEWIDYVSFAGISNSSASNNGYGDFTSQTANVGRGGSYVLTVSAGFSGQSYTENWRVWIDYDQDGNFESNELVSSGSSSSAANLTETVNIPTTATLGKTRMRVVMQYGTGTVSSCGSFNYGEVEDYSVNIGSSASVGVMADNVSFTTIGNEAPNFTLEVYPNPVTTGEITIYSGERGNTKYTITNLFGQIVKAGDVSNRPINVKELKTGVYLIQVNDGARNLTKKLIIK